MRIKDEIMSYQDNGSNFQALTLPKFLRIVAFKVEAVTCEVDHCPIEREREKRTSTLLEREVGLRGDRFFTYKSFKALGFNIHLPLKRHSINCF